MDKNEFNSSLYRPIIITLDGTSASGKGTLVKGLSKNLANYQTMDAGAMYRAITRFYIDDGIDSVNLVKNSGNDLSERLLNDINLELNDDGLILNGSRLTDKLLRGPEIDPFVGKYAGIDEVKRFAVDLQKRLVEDSGCGIILDGRCMGSAVAPQAQAKFFVDAPSLVRATRRHIDYVKDGKLGYSTEQIFIDLENRDKLDYDAKTFPLVKPENSIQIDTFSLSPEEGVEKVLKYVKQKIVEEGKL
jgi:cytidylate kinase